MGILDNPVLVQYTASGSAVFPFNFWVEKSKDLQVSVNGVLQTLSTHYSISGLRQNTGGQVTFVTPPAVGTLVLLKRRSVLESTQGFTNGQGFSADTLNDKADLVLAGLQEIWTFLSTVLTVGSLQGNENKLVAVNALGTALEFLGSLSGELLSNGSITFNKIESVDAKKILANPETTPGVAKEVGISGEFVLSPGASPQLSLAANGIELTKLKNQSANTILGCEAAGSVIPFSLGSGLSVSNGVITATGGGGGGGLSLEEVQDAVAAMVVGGSGITTTYDDPLATETIGLTLNGTAYDRLVQAPANTVLGNPAGSAGNIQAVTLGGLLAYQGTELAPRLTQGYSLMGRIYTGGAAEAVGLGQTFVILSANQKLDWKAPRHFIAGAPLVRASNTTLTLAGGLVCASDTNETISTGDSARTLNLAVNGVNGLDTGARAANTWYAIWAIGGGPSSGELLASLSFTAPTMPGGYTQKRLIMAVRTDASNNIVDFRMVGGWERGYVRWNQNYSWNTAPPYGAITNQQTTTAGTFQNSATLALVIPPSQIVESVNLTVRNTTAAGYALRLAAGHSGGTATAGTLVEQAMEANGTNNFDEFRVTAQTIAYSANVTAVASAFDCWVRGFQLRKDTY